MSLCDSCGNELSDGAEYCKSCGGIAPIPVNQEPTGEQLILHAKDLAKDSLLISIIDIISIPLFWVGAYAIKFFGFFYLLPIVLGQVILIFVALGLAIRSVKQVGKLDVEAPGIVKRGLASSILGVILIVIHLLFIIFLIFFFATWMDPANN